MVNIKSKFDCCGCEACAQTCNRQAITMQQDKQGFLYPKVNHDLCNNCGLCEKVCPLLENPKERIPLHTYALKNRNEETRHLSSSGGIFTILAENTINTGGVVYGAVFDKEWNVIHDRIDTIEGVARLRGSKYVQSRMAGVYVNVKKDLDNGIPVLFSGCHCQIAALLSFLRKKYSNLTTVDVLCGGVPSPRIWREYLDEQVVELSENIGNNTLSSRIDRTFIKEIKFRDKSQGWRNYSFDLRVGLPQNGEDQIEGVHSSISMSEHPFIQSWLHGFIMRPSCHKCHFRRGRSGSDYTIGDYWGIEKVSPEFSDNKGISMLLAYKNDILSIISNKSDSIETDYSCAADGQLSLLYNKEYVPTSIIFYFLHDKIGLKIAKTLKICLRIESARQQYLKIRRFMLNIIRKRNG